MSTQRPDKCTSSRVLHVINSASKMHILANLNPGNIIPFLPQLQ